MKHQKGDKLTLAKPLTIRTSYSIGTIPAGEEIEIQQADKRSGCYLVHNTWIHYTTIEKAVSQ